MEHRKKNLAHNFGILFADIYWEKIIRDASLKEQDLITTHNNIKLQVEMTIKKIEPRY